MTVPPPWTRGERVAVAGLVAVAVGMLATGLGQPAAITFDEIYYVNDARDLLTYGEVRRDLVHPPFAVQSIAASIALLGDHAAAWRTPSALAGAVTVLATTVLARRLTSRTWLALLAGGLVLADGVFLAQARIAMLDAMVVALVVVAVWALVVDRQRRTHPRTEGTPVATGHPGWLVVAGAALGLASAAKWSGLSALAGVALLAAVWELAAWRRRSVAGRPPTAWRALAGLLVAFVVAPAAIYTATWVPWMVAEQRAGACPADEVCPTGPGAAAGALAHHHLELARFHDGLTGSHRYQASPTTWLTQTRPVTLHWDRCDEQGRDRDDEPCAPPSRARQVTSLGNLALWWTGLLAVPVLAAAARRGQDRAAVVLTLLVVQYLPWLLAGRPTFSFYAVTLVPFVALAVVVALDEIGRARRWRWTLASAGLAGAVAAVATAINDTSLAVIVAWTLLASTLGAGLGAGADRRSGLSMSAHPRRTVIGGALVAVAATVLLAYFAPVWLGLERDLEVIEARWWLRSWI